MPGLGPSGQEFESLLPYLNGPLVKLAITIDLHSIVLGSSPSWSTYSLLV